MTSRSARRSILAATAVLAVFIVQSNAQDVGTGTFTITAPSPLTTTMCNNDAAVTFNLNVCEVGGTTAGSITAVKLYYTDDVNFESKNTMYTGVDATLTGGYPLAVTAGAGASTTAATATLTADTGPCGSSTYTHICAVVTATGDTVATNDDSCIAINGGATSTSNCPDDIQATTLTVTTPDPATGGFTEGMAVATTLTLAYTVTNDGATPSDVKIYFSNADGSVKSTEVTADGGDKPDGTTAVTADGSYDDLTATLTLDATNCDAYTKLCASITVTDDVTTNNEACADFGTGTGNAGTKTCHDIAASTFMVTSPAPATGVFYVGEAVATTFTLAYTVTGNGGSPSDVKVYFSNADGSTKSTEVTATGTDAPDGSVVGTDGSFAGLVASLTLDAANCDAYTQVCGLITVTDDDATNNAACAAFGTAVDQAGTKNCTTDAGVTTESPTDSGVLRLSFSFGLVVTMIITTFMG